MEMTWDEINTHIDSNGPEILKGLCPLLMSPVVLKQLVKEEVLLDHQELSLRYILDPATRCTNFLDLVKGGSVQVYYNLVKVAKLNRHHGLVTLLGDNEPDVQQPASVDQQPDLIAQLPTSVDQQPASIKQEPTSVDWQSASVDQQPASVDQQFASIKQDATWMSQQPAPLVQQLPVQAGEKEIPLWDKRHPDGQTLLFMEPELDRKLVEALPDLRRLVRPAALWAHLEKYDIMDSCNIEECQGAGVSGPQVEAVVKYLRQDLVWKLHGFFRSLAQIQQDKLIDLVLGDGAKEDYNQNLREF